MSAAATIVRESEGAAETAAFGAQLAARLSDGDIVHVRGEPGSGKTTFVRGAAAALGVSAAVTSPTFAIGHRYRAAGGLLVCHLDLYRLADLDAEDPGLLEDYAGEGRITFVEWPPSGGPPPRFEVELHHAGGDRRRIELRG